MSPTIDSSVLNTAKTKNAALIQKYNAAVSGNVEVQKRLNALNSTYEEKNNNLGWWTKAFAGNFGGDKSEVNAINDLVDEINKCEGQIKSDGKITLNLERELKEVVTELTHSSAPLISRKLALNKDFGVLKKAANSYSTLLTKASQGIKDATLFLSWSKLINHPEASEKIAAFKKSTQAFQEAVSSFCKNEEASISEINLMVMIKFSTEAEGMNSFRQIQSATNKILKHASTGKNENQKELDEYISSLKSQLLE